MELHWRARRNDTRVRRDQLVEKKMDACGTKLQAGVIPDVSRSGKCVSSVASSTPSAEEDVAAVVQTRDRGGAALLGTSRLIGSYYS